MVLDIERFIISSKSYIIIARMCSLVETRIPE